MTLMEPKVYAVSMRITPPLDEMSQSSGTSGGGILGSLMGSSQSLSRSFTELLNLLHSNRVAEYILNDPKRVARIFGPNWTRRDGKWVGTRSPGLVGSLKAGFLGLFGISIERGPTVPNAYNYLVAHVSILQSSDSSSLLGGAGQNRIVTISAVESTPKDAQALLVETVNAADTILKNNERKSLQQRVAYLTSRIATVSVAEYRIALANVLSEQEKSAMLIDDTSYYSLFVLDDAVLNTVPYSPKPTLNIIIGGGLGFVLGLLFVLFRDGRAGYLRR